MAQPTELAVHSGSMTATPHRAGISASSGTAIRYGAAKGTLGPNLHDPVLYCCRRASSSSCATESPSQAWSKATKAAVRCFGIRVNQLWPER